MPFTIPPGRGGTGEANSVAFQQFAAIGDRTMGEDAPERKPGKVLIIGRAEHAEVQAVRRAFEEAGASPVFVPPSEAAHEMAGPDDLWVFEDHESIMLIPWLVGPDGLPPPRPACRRGPAVRIAACPDLDRPPAGGQNSGEQSIRGDGGRDAQQVEAGILLLKMARSAWDVSFLTALSARYFPTEIAGGDSMEHFKEALVRRMTPGCRAILLLDLGLWPEKRRDLRFFLAAGRV
ncbi:MAG: hypothetical protein N3A38_00435 [Planctomycetota bacterium]|nr:hypothetical protein [Planctomycetota bacterium]